MNDKSPSIEEWKDLYDAAIEFKEAECWDWMWDSDVFGVQNPANGEIGYCCVMGRLREHFALGVYLGTEGLEGYLRLESGEDLPSDTDMLHLQKCLMASFEDRKLLQKQDLQLIKRLGLSFRGRNAWPLFRNYHPGYRPWYLTSEEVRYLTLALHQAIHVALRFQDDPDMLTPPAENQYLVRVPEKGKDGLTWKDEWLEPRPLERVEVAAEPVDANRLERIKRTIPQRRGVWEFDFFYSPMAVRDRGERPYYPYVIYCVEHYSGFILACDLIPHGEPVSGFAEHLLRLAERMKSLPEEIWVRREEAFSLLEPIASRLKIKLRDVARLTALEQAQASMFQFLMR